ncbi:MAG: hypothetical protein ACYDCO_28130 [Armatimonadota bacterium]
MAEHKRSTAPGKDIREEESQGDLKARITEKQGGVHDEDLLDPKSATEPLHREKKQPKKAA